MALEDVALYARRRLKRGEVLYRAGGSCDCLYAIRSGFFKCGIVSHDGREQVTSFRMAGEILGLDGIDNASHESEAQALEDSEVCIITHTQLDAPDLRRWLYRVMSREMTRDHGVMLLLGRMSSEERLAAFLLHLSQRLLARGLSARDFRLRMSREEIGSYLGLTVETVSRLFSRFHDERLLAVDKKHIRVLDYEVLTTMAMGFTAR